MINPYYFTDENLKNGFKINLESQNNIHAFIPITPIYSDFGIETIYNNKILKEISTPELINQNKL